jgi:hypothetical protein
MKGSNPMRTGTVEAVALSFLILSSASYAGWRDDAAPRDVDRLAHLSESRQKGLEEAASGNTSDVAAIRSILSAGTVAAGGRIAGNWRCRTMKLGGLTPEIVYSWFRCRISERDGRLFFEKLNGSQRTSGYLYREGDGYVYLGAQYVGSGYGPMEKRPSYSGNSTAAGAGETPDDQIGMLSLTYDGRARLELPYPVQESTFDVIELKR